MEKKLDGNYTRRLRAILNIFRRQHPTKQQLYGHLQPITKTIQVRRTRHAGHSWRSKDEVISDILRWTPAHGRAKAGRPAKTYIQQLCADTGCGLVDLPGAMEDRDGWREQVREIRAGMMMIMMMTMISQSSTIATMGSFEYVFCNDQRCLKILVLRLYKKGLRL